MSSLDLDSKQIDDEKNERVASFLMENRRGGQSASLDNRALLSRTHEKILGQLLGEEVSGIGSTVD